MEFSPPELEARVLRESQTVPRELHTCSKGSLSASGLPPCCHGARLQSGMARLSASSFFARALRRSRTAATLLLPLPCLATPHLALPSLASPRPARPDHTSPRRAEPHPALPRHTAPSHTLPNRAVPDHAQPHLATPCLAPPGLTRPRRAQYQTFDPT